MKCEFGSKVYKSPVEGIVEQGFPFNSKNLILGLKSDELQNYINKRGGLASTNWIVSEVVVKEMSAGYEGVLGVAQLEKIDEGLSRHTIAINLKKILEETLNNCYLEENLEVQFNSQISRILRHEAVHLGQEKRVTKSLAGVLYFSSLRPFNLHEQPLNLVAKAARVAGGVAGFLGKESELGSRTNEWTQRICEDISSKVTGFVYERHPWEKEARREENASKVPLVDLAIDPDWRRELFDSRLSPEFAEVVNKIDEGRY